MNNNNFILVDIRNEHPQKIKVRNTEYGKVSDKNESQIRRALRCPDDGYAEVIPATVRTMDGETMRVKVYYKPLEQLSDKDRKRHPITFTNGGVANVTGSIALVLYNQLGDEVLMTDAEADTILSHTFTYTTPNRGKFGQLVLDGIRFNQYC